MNYIEFSQKLSVFDIFSLQDIKKIYPTFDSRRLVEWQQKKYIEKIINRWYRFTNSELHEPQIWWAATRIYAPAYISLESALSFHGAIPEGVFQVTAISTNKTQQFHTNIGNFHYRSVKPSLFFGYTIYRTYDKPIRIADLEKTLLDYCYFNNSLKEATDFETLRLNIPLLQAQLDRQKLHNYLTLMESVALEKRVNHLINFIQNA